MTGELAWNFVSCSIETFILAVMLFSCMVGGVPVNVWYAPHSWNKAIMLLIACFTGCHCESSFTPLSFLAPEKHELV